MNGKIIIPLIVLAIAYACKGHDEHSTAQVNLVADGNKATAEIKMHGEPFVGFEHRPTTFEEVQKANDALFGLASNINVVIQQDPPNACDGRPRITFEEDGHHTIFVIVLEMECTNALAGSKLSFGFQSLFPEVERVELNYIGSEVVKETLSAGESVQLPQ